MGLEDKNELLCQIEGLRIAVIKSAIIRKEDKRRICGSIINIATDVESVEWGK